MDLEKTPEDELSYGIGLYLSGLPPQERDYLRAIFAGKALPPFCSGIIAKTVLNPDVSPYRLNFLLRGIVGDESIEVIPSVPNAIPGQPPQPRAMILDASSRQLYGSIADSEARDAMQSLILASDDLHASDMLILRYSVDRDYPKAVLPYVGAQETILVALMTESPKPFEEFDATSNRYIHRFPCMVADSGLSYEMRPKVVYVQCDKCLAQLREGVNAEAPDGMRDRLQVWLASFADPNAPEVLEWAANDPELEDMMDTAAFIAQDKGVQAVLTLERNARIGRLSYGTLWKAQCVAEDFAKDFARGQVNVLLKLVRSGDISIDTAASHLGISADYFVRRHMVPTEA